METSGGLGAIHHQHHHGDGGDGGDGDNNWRGNTAKMAWMGSEGVTQRFR